MKPLSELSYQELSAILDDVTKNVFDLETKTGISNELYSLSKQVLLKVENEMNSRLKFYASDEVEQKLLCLKNIELKEHLTKVICVKVWSHVNLTKGQNYDVIETKEDQFKIVDDKGNEKWFKKDNLMFKY